jgi:hypothetical protein
MPIQKITTGVIDGTTTFANTAISGTITASQIATVNANTITSGTIPLAQVPRLSNVKMPAGSVLQVVQASFNQKTTINSAAIKVMETSITTTATNSKILAILSCAIGGNNTYADHDLGLAIGYKTGSASSTSTDYTAVHYQDYSRQVVAGLGSFYANDTTRSGDGSIYWTEEKTYLKLISPNQSSGTNIYISFWGSTDGTYYLGSPSGSTATDAGSEMSLTLLEIAA